MVKLYTSWYGFAGHLPKAVSISGWPPEGWDKKHCLKLAPRREVYDRYMETHDSDIYSMYFGMKIALLEPDGLYKLAKWLGDGAILCCYEPPGQFCHRKLVSEWFNFNGIECSELTLAEKIAMENSLSSEIICG